MYNTRYEPLQIFSFYMPICNFICNLYSEKTCGLKLNKLQIHRPNRNGQNCAAHT